MSKKAGKEITRRKDALWDDELWGKSPNPGSRCRYLVVVGPYPTKAFFSKFVEKYAPKKVLIVIDEGWRDDEIREVEKALAGVKHSIRYAGRRGGLVHAKLYYVEWEVKRGGNVRRRLLWGSPNASQGGFDANAEALSSASLPAGSPETAAIEAYFTQCAENEPSTPVKQVLVSPVPGLRLLLPAFELRRDLKDISFDAWVQKGVLCHPYLTDPGFGSFTVRLKRPLPTSALVKYVSSKGATSDAKHDVLRFPFFPIKPPGKGEKLSWKRRYFVETWLGFWTSAECASAVAKEELIEKDGKPVRFVAPGDKARQKALDAIKQVDEEGQGPEATRYLDAHLKRLRALHRGLSKKTKSGLYFEKLPNGELDEDYYREQARKQLLGQRTKAQRQWFYTRFRDGFEVQCVPPLRGIGGGAGGASADSFEEFVGSLAQTLTVLASKRRKENRLLLTIAHALNSSVAPEEAIPENFKKLLHELRVRWAANRDQIRAFHG